MLNNLGVLLFAVLSVHALASTTSKTSSIFPDDQDGSGDDEDWYSGSGMGGFLPASSTKSTISTSASGATTTPRGSTADEHKAQSTTVKEKENLTSASTSRATADEPAVLLGEVDSTVASGQQTASTKASTTFKAAITTSAASTGLSITTAPKKVRMPDTHIQTSEDTTTTTFHTVAIIEGDLHSQLPNTTVFPGSEEGSGMNSSSSSDDIFFETNPEQTDNAEVTEIKPEVRENNNQEQVTEGEKSDSMKGMMENKGVLGAVIAGGVVGLMIAMALLGLMLYRMKKKDEGSYSLEEPKQSNGGYQKPQRQEEFYA